jgi:purine nucleosidase
LTASHPPDAGVDDAYALVMAFKLAAIYGYQLKAITTVFGNCSLSQVIKNVSKIRQACGHNSQTGPSIYRGSSSPLRPETMIDATYFHGNDGLGNNNYLDEESGVGDHSSSKSNSSERADEAASQIIQFCHESKAKNEKAVVVMLGPLTNLARAIQIQDDLVTLIDSLVIMGGCGNGHGNVNRTTEFNITADCEAAALVFQSLSHYHKICTIVSWELTLANTIPWELFDQLNQPAAVQSPIQGPSSSDTQSPSSDTHSPSSETESPSSDTQSPSTSGESPREGQGPREGLCRVPSSISSFLHTISQFSYHPKKRIPIPHYSLPSEHFHGAVICDALALAVALNSQQLIRSQALVNVEVELKGEITRGQTVVDWGCYDGITRTKNCQWVLAIETEVFVEMFKRMYQE